MAQKDTRSSHLKPPPTSLPAVLADAFRTVGIQMLYENAAFFSTFRYVCPERVLVKWSFIL
eukprot:COSAG06_NODE_3424_length_5365_cov_15.833080_1_plen_61_part_00